MVRGSPLIVYDSAGIEVVDFDLDQLPSAGLVSEAPAWVFGAEAGARHGVPLSEVRAARLLKDGRVALINGIAEELLLVEEDGQEWQRLGSRGEGPGEFSHITSVAEEDNGLGVFDEWRRVWVSFRDGEYFDSWEPPPTGVPGLFYPEVVLPDGEGFYVGDAFLPPGASGGVPTRRLLLLTRVEAGVLDTLAIVPADTGTPKGVGISILPFGARYALERADAGVWIGDSARPEVAFRGRDGAVQRISRWRTRQSRTLTRRRINEAMEWAIGLVDRSAASAARLRDTWRETDFPEMVPAWGTFLLGTDGVLWISDYAGPEVELPTPKPHPVQEWWSIDSAGRPIGKLVSPEGLEVTGFGRGFLIGIHRDSLDVETLRRYEIKPPPLPDRPVATGQDGS